MGRRQDGDIPNGGQGHNSTILPGPNSTPSHAWCLSIWRRLQAKLRLEMREVERLRATVDAKDLELERVNGELAACQVR